MPTNDWKIFYAMWRIVIAYVEKLPDIQYDYLPTGHSWYMVHIDVVDAALFFLLTSG